MTEADIASMDVVAERRFRPLYVWSFFEGLIFWYSIEKVFMVSIGFTAATISLCVIVTTLAGMLVALPGGILADRWSRKKVLILSTIAITVASLWLGISASPSVYIIGSVLVAVNVWLRSGVLNAMIYDANFEVRGSRVNYERYFGRTTLLHGLAMFVAAFAGSLLATKFGLASPYWFSIPSGLIALVALAGFAESHHHTQANKASVLLHVGSIFRNTFQSPYTLLALVVVVFSTCITDFLLDVGQLWPLQLGLRLELYGLFTAVLLLGYSVGAVVANTVKRRTTYMSIACVVGVLSTLLLSVQNLAIVVIGMFGMMSAFILIFTVALGKLNDSLRSNLRSGGSSLAGLLGSLVYCPVLLVFGHVAASRSVFVAAWILTPLALITAVAMIAIARTGKDRQSYASYEGLSNDLGDEPFRLRF